MNIFRLSGLTHPIWLIGTCIITLVLVIRFDVMMFWLAPGIFAILGLVGLMVAISGYPRSRESPLLLAISIGNLVTAIVLVIPTSFLVAVFR